MPVEGRGNVTYLLINGLSVCRPLRLGEGIDLLPAQCAPSPESLVRACKNEVDLGIATVFLRQVTSQLRIEASDAQSLATKAWNSQWDIVMLSAFCLCTVECNLQTDLPTELFGAESHLNVTNYHMRGLSADVHEVTTAEAEWLEANFVQSRQLLADSGFMNAVHCLCSYRWHPHPRVQLAVLWSGVEGLFAIESELVFRISLYIARYLAPDDASERGRLFALVKTLYKQRSTAVHGSKLKGEPQIAVGETAELLRRLLRRAVTDGIPEVETLAP